MCIIFIGFIICFEKHGCSIISPFGRCVYYACLLGTLLRVAISFSLAFFRFPFVFLPFSGLYRCVAYDFNYSRRLAEVAPIYTTMHVPAGLRI